MTTNVAHDAIRMPELIPIPAGAASKVCTCGVRFWWTRHKGKPVAASCPATIETKSMGTLALPTRAPTGTTAGVGIYHHIDCTNRKEFGTGGDAVARASEKALGPRPVMQSADTIADRIRQAEALAERWNVRCTGAPQLTETCGGFAVIAFVLGDTLFAAPCSAHADAVYRALKFDRRSDFTTHDLHEYLQDRGDAVAQRFYDRCALIRQHNAASGFRVPPRGIVS